MNYSALKIEPQEISPVISMKKRMFRITALEINLANIIKNLNLIRNYSKESDIIAVLKADSYGLGSYEIARVLSQNGVYSFAVAIIEEGISLREKDLPGEILLFSPLYEKEVKDIIYYNITPTIMSLEDAQMLSYWANYMNHKIKVHIKIDTGMGRLGCNYKKAVEIIEEVIKLKNITLNGIYSHFSTADTDDIEYAEQQLERFNSVLNELERRNINIPKKHIANSGGIVRLNNSHFNAVRPGLLLYGCLPSDHLKQYITPFPVITLKSHIAVIKDMDEGESISYGRTCKTGRKTKMAVVPMGYADGYSTLFSNKGCVLINGYRCPVLGRVTMDYTMVDVTDVPNVEPYDEVIMLGEELSPEYLSKMIDIIPYEILTNISKRVPRIYKM